MMKKMRSDPQVEQIINKAIGLINVEVVTESYGGEKKREGSEGIKGTMLYPKLGKPIGLWGNKAKQAFYSVEKGMRLPQFYSAQENEKWQLMFCYRPGPNSSIYNRLHQILKIFQSDQSLFSGVIVPRGHILVNGWKWSYLHFVKRYAQHAPDQIAHDLAFLVNQTLPRMAAL